MSTDRIDHDRLATWVFEIAKVLLPLDTRTHEDGNERKFSGQGGLTINLRSGLWYCHAAGRGGAVLGLIRHLKKCGTTDAVRWAAAFLSAHPGNGQCEAVHSEDGAPSAWIARDILDRLVAVTGTPGETYLRSRGIVPPYPACVRFVQHARAGECGLVGVPTAKGRITGVQIGYLDPDGRKTTLAAKRKRFNLEPAPDAVFEIPETSPDLRELKTAMVAAHPDKGGSDEAFIAARQAYEWAQSPGDDTTVVVVEGLENALTISQHGNRRCRVIGLPGIGTLQHLRFAPGTRVIVFQDSDPDGSPAAKALQAGVDRLLLNGVAVFITPKAPDGYDANKILTELGAEVVASSLDRAEPAQLSLDGEIRKLASLNPIDYDRIRAQAARDLGVRVSTLDDLVAKARAAAAAAAAPVGDDEEDWFDAGQTRPWPNPVNGTDLLNEIIETVGKFVVMNDAQRLCVALWVLFTHVFDSATNAPKLWIKSAERRSGKTRLLELLAKLAARAIRADMISAAMIPRVIEARRPTLLLDEIDTYIGDNEALRGVINAGFDRDTQIIIGMKVGDNWVPTPFSPWCPQALAGIGDLPDTIADRSFKIELDRKPRGTKVARLRRRDHGPLDELAQKLVRWAKDNMADLVDAEPPMPNGLNDRAADAWETCVAIADLLGGDWPNRARIAALAISGDGALAEDESVRILLIGDIRGIFEGQNERIPDRHEQALPSFDIAERLGAMEHRPWPEFKRGQPITPTQMARVLAPFHITPQLLRRGQVVFRGYERPQFEKAWERYLPPLPDPESPSPTPPSSPPPTWNDGFGVTPLQSEDLCGFQPDFRGVTDEGCNASENVEKPSISADCNDVTPKSHKHEGGGKNGVSNGLSSTPDDDDPESVQPPSASNGAGSIEAEAIALAAENPDWSVKRLAKHLGQPESRIARYLPDHNPPPKPSVKRSIKPKTDSEKRDPDPEIDRVVEILRNAGKGGETASVLYFKHGVYGQTLTKAAGLGLIRDDGGRWSLS
jgi:hypothetical protein